ncbi:winged helix-turn-helix domain-containing protein [Frankia sp. CcWB3]
MRTTLLLVGDEAAMHRDLVPALLGEGYAVEMAGSGEAALADLVARPAQVHLLLARLPPVLPPVPARRTGSTTDPASPPPDGCPDTVPALIEPIKQIKSVKPVDAQAGAPAIDGLEFCRRLRAAGDLPLIMVAGRSDPARIVAGLEAGADDCVTAPPVTAEVLARIRALLRRARPGQSTASALSVGELQIRPAEGVVSRRGEGQHLTRTEFLLLCELAVAGGRVVSRKQLLERVWGYGHFGGTRMLDVHVRRLRRKVEADPSAPTHILTVRGVGYRVCCSSPTSRVAAPLPTPVLTTPPPPSGNRATRNPPPRRTRPGLAIR